MDTLRPMDTPGTGNSPVRLSLASLNDADQVLEMGFGSLGAVELRNRLSKVTGPAAAPPVPPDAVIDGLDAAPDDEIFRFLDGLDT
ncbi:acyl carrier protein [Streptomyces sp. NBC_00316]|uniref:acyl carrier protein n=1 Tax=Streptomyces sp. NBC_00316 TaxID=2975710 RepID=UPI002E2CD7E7|nr:acyl carrier protein [Streptomyces sp. NBC_00316]